MNDVCCPEITLYSTGCPKCRILEKKLQSKGIPYSKNTNIDGMTNLGFDSVPVLGLDDKYLNFTDAIKWINGVKRG